MSYTVELNSARRDADFVTKEYNPHTGVVEVFSAMVNGKSLDKFGKNMADKSVNYIKELASKANNGDSTAVAELNTIRKYAIEPELMKEIQLLGFFGSYENVGYGESIEREVVATEGELSRVQAANGDVPLGFIASKTYPVGTQTISAGYQIDYRKLQMGDLSAENALKENIKRDMRNKASRYALMTVYNSIKNATGVKNFSESTPITKTAVDNAIKFARRFGVPSIVGDYSVVSQINDFVPYASATYATFNDISPDAMEEIRKTGLVSWYNGSPIYAIQNAFDTSKLNAAGTGFNTVAPEGLLFVIPAGVDSPVKLWTRGGLTSFTGNDVTTGRQLTRYDLEVAVDVAKGQEYKLGLIRDTQFDL